MSWRRHGVRFLLVAVLLVLDTLLGRHAVNVNAAGALLSPGGAMPLGALLTALGFVAARVGWIVLMTYGVAVLVANAVGEAMDRWVFGL